MVDRAGRRDAAEQHTVMEYNTIAQLSAAFAAHSVSPVEVTIDLLQRIDQLDPVLHAFIQVTPDLALHEAKQAEARLMAGRRLGALDGVPVAHKDNFDTAGVTTTANSALFRTRVPVRDAVVVTNWSTASAVS